MHAAWPWSGHYVPTPQLYVSAHTTQFASVGWKYAAVGSGSGLLSKGGSYVTLVSTAETTSTVAETLAPDLSAVVEKMSHEGSTSAWAGLPAYDTANETLVLRLGQQYVTSSRFANGAWGGCEHCSLMCFPQVPPIEHLQPTISDACDSSCRVALFILLLPLRAFARCFLR